MSEFDERLLSKLEEMSDAEIVQLEKQKANTRSKRIRSGFMIFFSIFVSFLLLVVALFSVSTFLFRVNKVVIDGNSRYTDDEILSASGLNDIKNIIPVLFRKNDIKNNIESEYAYVKNAEINVVFPSTVNVTIEEDNAMWYGKIYGEWFVLSENLRVIEKLASPDDRFVYGDGLKWIKLPEIDRAVVGEKIEFNKVTAYDYTVSFLEELSEQDVFEKLEYIDVSDRYHIAVYMNQKRIQMILGDAKSLQAKITLIDNIIAKQETLSPTTIVSFNAEYVNPVIMLKGSEIFTYDE